MNELDFYTSERTISEKYSFHAGLERADENTISCLQEVEKCFANLQVEESSEMSSNVAT